MMMSLVARGWRGRWRGFGGRGNGGVPLCVGFLIEGAHFFTRMEIGMEMGFWHSLENEVDE